MRPGDLVEIDPSSMIGGVLLRSGFIEGLVLKVSQGFAVVLWQNGRVLHTIRLNCLKPLGASSVSAG